VVALKLEHEVVTGIDFSTNGKLVIAGAVTILVVLEMYNSVRSSQNGRAANNRTFADNKHRLALIGMGYQTHIHGFLLVDV